MQAGEEASCLVSEETLLGINGWLEQSPILRRLMGTKNDHGVYPGGISSGFTLHALDRKRKADDCPLKSLTASAESRLGSPKGDHIVE